MITTQQAAEWLEMSALYVDAVRCLAIRASMPHIDDMQGLDDYDKLLVADMDYSRPVYQGDSDDVN